MTLAASPPQKLAAKPGTIRFIVQDGQMTLVAPDGTHYPVDVSSYGSRC